jgi:hypothetical protein
VTAAKRPRKRSTDLQVPEEPALEIPLSSRPLISPAFRNERADVPAGRANGEADRKRAYRSRKAADLAEPLRLREEASQAVAEAVLARADALQARSEASRWQAKAESNLRRAQRAEEQAETSARNLREAVAKRKRAEKLCRSKLAWARHATPLRNDPDALLAVISDLVQQSQTLRDDRDAARRQVVLLSTRLARLGFGV